MESLYIATYLSLPHQVVKTIGNGDCGLDAVCLMLGRPRSLQSRKNIRTALVAFALKHIGNRALIAMLFGVAELEHHLGLYELESAGASLMACPDEEPVVSTHHGDGDGVLAPIDPLPSKRVLREEEVSAVARKCRLMIARTAVTIFQNECDAAAGVSTQPTTNP